MICTDSKAIVMQPFKYGRVLLLKRLISFDDIYIYIWSIKRALKFKGTHWWWRKERRVINRGYQTMSMHENCGFLWYNVLFYCLIRLFVELSLSHLVMQMYYFTKDFTDPGTCTCTCKIQLNSITNGKQNINFK